MSLYAQRRFEEWPPAGFDGLFDWDFLSPAFKRGIMPMDIDALIECNRHFLVYETKDCGKEIPTGQRYTLERLVNLRCPNCRSLVNAFTVLVVRGKRPELIRDIELWTPGEQRRTSADPQMVVDLSRQWFERAERDSRA